ncbi:hypothetical protein BSL78_27378 [Apostichopus japonicus]|uniref:Uncharacterized protein n=1 Tax=Stichopus japonicus TaxID=307972 RepID=A0A2G8JJ77_STIJA|nr:hypothetical protein BSL78_27378 [Apostichopus japonicus]
MIYSTRRVEGFALSDGEQVERLWSFLRNFSRSTKEMSASNRIDAITEALLHYSKKKINAMGNIILQRSKRAEESLKTSKKELADALSNQTMCHTCTFTNHKMISSNGSQEKSTPSSVQALATGHNLTPQETYAIHLCTYYNLCLSLVMRDAADDGRKALKILREHYSNQGKPRIITLYTELTSLKKGPNESITDYIIRAEKAITALRNAKETLSDGLLIAMILKGLPDSFKPFAIHITQSNDEITFTKFKSKLRSFEETEKFRVESHDKSDNVMKAGSTGTVPTGSRRIKGRLTCYQCGNEGHIARLCPYKLQTSNKSQTKLPKMCNYHNSSTHSDETCRRHNRKDKAKQTAEQTETREEDHTFSFKAVNNTSNIRQRGGPGTLMVDCGDVVKGMKIKGEVDKSTFDCDTCTQEKFVNSRSRKLDAKATTPLELVHTDLAGLINPVAKDGFKYAATFTDDYSGAIYVYFIGNKGDTALVLEKFLADCAPYGKVKCIRPDNGSEFTGNAFESVLRKMGIRHETASPYLPHKNGTAERQWRTLFEMGRCLLIDKGLPKFLWTYAVQTAAHIRNRCFNNRIKQTPYYMLTGNKPDLSKMGIFGSECYAYKHDPKKLDSRCEKGIFVGYDIVFTRVTRIPGYPPDAGLPGS